MLRLKKIEGVWYVHGTVAGRRIRKSCRTGHKPTAHKERARIEVETWAERHDPQAGKVAFEVAAGAYLEAGGEGRFILPLLEHFKGQDITTIKPGNVQDAARKLYPGRKPATWNRNAVTPMRAVLSFAAERGWCSPIRIKSFSVEKVQRKAADREWLDAFMAKASPEIAALALFMFTTGARISEALNLEWSGVQGRVAYTMSKNGPQEKHLSRELMLILQGLERKNKRVFLYKSRSSVYNRWYEICDAADIERLPPHQAGRHAFGTEMIVRQGIDPATTAKLGGWKSPRILMETYAHPESLTDVVDQVFGEVKPRKVKE